LESCKSFKNYAYLTKDDKLEKIDEEDKKTVENIPTDGNKENSKIIKEESMEEENEKYGTNGKILKFDETPKTSKKDVLNFDDTPKENKDVLNFDDTPKENKNVLNFDDTPKQNKNVLSFSDTPKQNKEVLNLEDTTPKAAKAESDSKIKHTLKFDKTEKSENNLCIIRLQKCAEEKNKVESLFKKNKEFVSDNNLCIIRLQKCMIDFPKNEKLRKKESVKKFNRKKEDSLTTSFSDSFSSSGMLESKHSEISDSFVTTSSFESSNKSIKLKKCFTLS